MDRSLKPTQSSSASSSEKKRKLPTAEELIRHYESQGLESREASVKVIEDLQKALLRVVNSTKKEENVNVVKLNGRKLDVINSRLMKLETKVDSKPGYAETLAIGIASGAALRGIGTIFPRVVHVFAHVWNSVRSATSTTHH